MSSSSSSSSSDSEHEEAAATSAPAEASVNSSPASKSAESSDDDKPIRKRMLSDSSDDEEQEKEKTSSSKKLIEQSDDDLDSEREGDVTKKSDLFGDDLSSSDDDNAKEKEEEKVRKSDDSDAESVDQLRGIVMHQPGEDEMDEEEEEKEKIIISEATVPKIQSDFGEGAFYVKVPNFLSVSTHPFDPELYEEDEDDDQVKMDEEGRNRLKLRVENTIRWRKTTNENGEETMESNAKFVKWSDGTMSMYLGNEIFEVTMMPLNVHNYPHLYVRQQGGMAAQTVLQKKLTFRPHSTDSQTHRKVTLNMADRTRKSGSVKVMDEVGHNPEIQRRENAKKEEELLRQHIRRTQMMRNTYKPRYNRMGGDGYSDDEEVPTRRPKPKKKEAPIIGASSDEEEEDVGRRDRESDETDSDEEYRKRKQQQKKTIVTSDEDSS